MRTPSLAVYHFLQPTERPLKQRKKNCMAQWFQIQNIIITHTHTKNDNYNDKDNDKK